MSDGGGGGARLMRSVGPLTGPSLFTDADSPVLFTLPIDAGVRGYTIAIGEDDPGVSAVVSSLRTSSVHPALAGSAARNTSIACARSGETETVMHTVEHALAALAGLGVADARIVYLGEGGVRETPIFDGSAAAFVEALLPAIERTPGDNRASVLELRDTVRVEGAHGSWVEIEPADEPSYVYEFAWPGREGPVVRAEWACDAAGFVSAVAGARTFSLASEAAAMRAAGLFGRFTPRDLLVLDDETLKPIENELRFADEPARHKLLDLIGDLSLAFGGPLHRRVRARVVAHRSGHALNHAAARAVAAVR